MARQLAENQVHHADFTNAAIIKNPHETNTMQYNSIRNTHNVLAQPHAD